MAAEADHVLELVQKGRAHVLQRESACDRAAGAGGVGYQGVENLAAIGPRFAESDHREEESLDHTVALIAVAADVIDRRTQQNDGRTVPRPRSVSPRTPWLSIG
jgi:hypothetical protein